MIGGFALAPHGYIRAAKDLDVVPDRQPANLARLAQALRTLEARVDLGDLGADELGIAPDEAGLAPGGNWCLTTRYGRLAVMQTSPACVPGRSGARAQSRSAGSCTPATKS